MAQMDRWKKIEELFGAAIDLPDEERAAFLRAKCAGDEELRAEVESLLAADRKNGEGILAAIEQEALSLVGGTSLAEARIGADRKSTRLNSSHIPLSRMPSSA